MLSHEQIYRVIGDPEQRLVTCSPNLVGILKEVDAGAKVSESCRKYGIFDATYYDWKA